MENRTHGLYTCIVNSINKYYKILVSKPANARIFPAIDSCITEYFNINLSMQVQIINMKTGIIINHTTTLYPHCNEFSIYDFPV